MSSDWESFDPKAADPWKVSETTILPKGNYVVSIDSVDVGRSKNGHPQLVIQLSCPDGEIRDYRVITPASFGGVLNLAVASGAELSEPELQYFKDNSGEPPMSWVKRLVGMKVGIVVDEKPKQNDPQYMRSEVQGYVEAARIRRPGPKAPPAASEVPNDFGGFASAPQPVPDDEVPF
jgi:hypothetical protein